MKDLKKIERPPELSDGRLRLRALRPEDKAAVVEALNDPLAARYLTRPPFPYRDKDFDDWLVVSQGDWPLRHAAHWAIADERGDWTGGISLEIDELDQIGEIGYQVAPWARRTGVAAAAVRLVRDWGFDDLGLGRLEILTAFDNIASQRVALATGFSREGVLRGAMNARGERRDSVVFGMVPDDPRPGAGTTSEGARPESHAASAAVRPRLGWPRLDDGLVVVRPFELEDAEAVRAACDDPDVAHWIFGLPSPYTLADAEAFVAECRQRLVAGDRARLAIADGAGGFLLGSISLDLFADRQAAEIGYWVARTARRRGVALAAARLVVRWAFEQLGIERLEILTYPGNEASQALAQALGFRRECLLRGFLAVEPGKGREGRVVPSDDGSLPARDDQVQLVLLREEWGRAR